jgi:nitroimidazol reductase NimA-like FMN-containing flavoprotein (pyridoxamine 5'-phosphate oxidase superfamily)
VSTPAVLSPEECRDLLSAEVVGRVALATSKGPRIVPVNYALDGDAVVFRTSAYSEVGVHGRDAELAFEVDQVDHERHQGWSVVVVGHASVVDDPEDVARIRRNWDPRPWAGGSRNLLIRLPWREISGRRVGEDWTPDRMTPYRRTV